MNALSSNQSVSVNQSQEALKSALDDSSLIDLSWIESMPPEDGWTLGPSVLIFVGKLLKYLQPKHILEFGSGLSTQFLMNTCNELGIDCSISAVDHDEDYCWTPRDQFVSARFKLQIAPVVVRLCAGKFLPVYNLKTELLASQEPVDLVIIDGPPETLGGREGVLYQCVKFSKPGTLILLDDASRVGEVEALKQWKEKFKDAIEVINLPGFTKGLAAIIIKKSLHKYSLDILAYHSVIEDITNIIPTGETFILIDEQQIGTESIPGRKCMPFVEKDGQYWDPSDSKTAINGLEQSIAKGANYVVLIWSTFWVLNYYKELGQYLNERFQNLFENEQTIVFQLRM